jgi:hypothetical protein
VVESHNLAFEVIESVPVHEDIKLGKPSRDRLIANYQQSIRNLGACACHSRRLARGSVSDRLLRHGQSPTNARIRLEQR